jgi:hypothetical protein
MIKTYGCSETIAIVGDWCDLTERLTSSENVLGCGMRQVLGRGVVVGVL